MALAILAAVFALVLAPAAAQGPIFGTITGPPALAPSQVSAYNLTINGGPTGAVTYTVRWHLNGGGLPTAASPTTTTGNRTTFTLNVTAPPTEGTVTLVVQVASLAGSTYENTTAEKAISIITPIVLSATFRNDGTTAAVNVTVRFYVDGALAGIRKIARLNPGAQVTETFAYLPSGLQPGTHQVRVEADLDGNGIIDPAKGEAVATSLFYRGTAPLSTARTGPIRIGVVVPPLLPPIALPRRKRA